ncbi:MAG TPA: DEAD/DEAH box helicase family protein [Povalibacter sp.]|uniref:DEAD/DEAH box helicase n=1 Tax=Povalibacter sp. TaxID=1962978 RepID=UPI002C39DE0E|nr:DEAD/DEAH box helicase family protein [Povalibacter sp.]HMN46568.1 DEAD/DEAH box helicase family protein [Povalibacter sp.]
MSAFAAKQYQQAALRSVEAYFRNCHALGSPSLAFTATTEQLWQHGMAYHSVEGFAADMPYFCLRVPTGGGKTFLAAKCAALINMHLLRTEYSVLLWLVPSKAIRDQTLRLLKKRDTPLHTALADAGNVTVLDLDEAKSITRASLETSTVVIVATVQAFNREEKDGLKVYQSNGALMPHFENLAPEQRTGLLTATDKETGEATMSYSLANVLRLHRPFLIVDEAHNNRTELAFSTLAKFNPSGILELTATPDTEKTPSNVLHSVSAVELKTEHMIKLPILLEAESDWQKCLAYAADKREQLQTVADAEQHNGAEYLRPLVLIQAQARSATRDTLHWERVRKELIENQGIPSEYIAVATGERNELVEIDARYPKGIADERCPVRFVITQQALAEGWDCPSAYILASLAGTQSETAVEQLLGRILRQPGAMARNTPELNQSHAYVMSSDFTAIASALRDRLVQGAGFERKAVEEFVRAGNPSQARFDMSARPGRIVVTPVAVPLATTPSIKQLPKPLQHKVEWDKQAKELVIRQPLTIEETAQLAETVTTPEERAAIVQAGETSRTTAVEVRLCPADTGEVLSVPALALQVQGELQFFDDPEVLDYPFNLSGYDANPGAEDLQALGLADRIASGGRIDVSDEGKVKFGFIADLQRDLGSAYKPEHWDEVKLAAWLCRNLPDSGITHASKWAFVLHWLRNLLQQPGCDLARANRQKFLMRGLLESRIRELRRNAVRQAYQQVLFGEDARARVKVGGEFNVIFNPQAYAPNADYTGKYGDYDFRHHYYGRIGDFDSREEFECACKLDQFAAQGRIKFWVRNLVNKPGCSFFLQKADGRFFPDFICRLPDSRILVVEYKGGQGWTDAQDDRDIGNLWAELSGAQCRFLMVRNKDWAQIEAKL